MSDLINRQDAIDGADEIIKRDTSGNNAVVEAMKAWKTYIGNFPSVEHKCGKWYSYSRFRMNKWEYGYGCTCCKEWNAKETNYCPNCGADMRKGEKK